jgi:hypothetical protein
MVTAITGAVTMGKKTLLLPDLIMLSVKQGSHYRLLSVEIPRQPMIPDRPCSIIDWFFYL